MKLFMARGNGKPNILYGKLLKIATCNHEWQVERTKHGDQYRCRKCNLIKDG